MTQFSNPNYPRNLLTACGVREVSVIDEDRLKGVKIAIDTLKWNAEKKLIKKTFRDNIEDGQLTDEVLKAIDFMKRRAMDYLRYGYRIGRALDDNKDIEAELEDARSLNVQCRNRIEQFEDQIEVAKEKCGTLEQRVNSNIDDISCLGLSSKALNILKRRLNIQTVYGLLLATASDFDFSKISKANTCGEKTVAEIRCALENFIARAKTG